MKFKQNETRYILLVMGIMVTAASLFACENDSIQQADRNQPGESAMNVNQEVGEVDSPDGFKVDVLAPHAPFTDELAAQFRLTFAGTGGEAIENNFDDASTMIIAEVNWEESGSTSGWHMHPGIALVSMVDGEIEVTWDRDCEPRTYSAGDGWLDPGDIHNATSVSNGAKAYVTFLGIPDGEPATVWVEPADCDQAE
ncbi:MAG: hypothetical protein WEA56_09820 [Balneolaceae bacterium]